MYFIHTNGLHVPESGINISSSHKSISQSVNASTFGLLLSTFVYFWLILAAMKTKSES
jgi:hypothetical protein